MSLETAASVPLWLLYEDEIESWRMAQSPALRTWLDAHDFKAQKQRVMLVPDADGVLLLAIGGLGPRNGTLSLWHGAALADQLPARRFRLAQAFTRAEATQLLLGFLYGAYRFDRYRPCRVKQAASLEAPSNADQTFAIDAVDVLRQARDLINTPASDLGPAELAAAARMVAERHGAAYAEWVGDALFAAKLPAIHAVGRASAAAPRLIDVRWSPAGARERPLLTLVGKGVCFDSGGLDIKSGSGMALMKKDMGGAAVALGLADLLMRSKIRARLRLLIPAVENSIGGNAYRPGDVLKTHKGLTVEVGNTDAEGRLILCDALALADTERPDLLMDFATLTGAARVALGAELPALFGSNEKTVADLARCAGAEHDPMWPMPLWASYDDELNSKIADLNNVAAGGFAGAIFGALFLKRFVTATPDWVHVDLYAWNSKERPGRGIGAEPHTVRGVYRYLVERYGTGD